MSMLIMISITVGGIGIALIPVWFLAGNGGMDPYDSQLRSFMVLPITL